jgi:hypothetical protein
MQNEPNELRVEVHSTSRSADEDEIHHREREPLLTNDADKGNQTDKSDAKSESLSTNEANESEEEASVEEYAAESDNLLGDRITRQNSTEIEAMESRTDPRVGVQSSISNGIRHADPIAFQRSSGKFLPNLASICGDPP